MSSGAHTATRRQIRKAFGADAVDAITSRDDTLKALALKQNECLDELLRANEYNRVLADRIRSLDAFRARGFWSRLNWLVRGH